MPVIDGVFTPSRPLTRAERNIDFPSHHSHVTERRAIVERTASRHVKQLAASVVQLGLPSQAKLVQLEDALTLALERTVRFGHREATREIRAHRGSASAADVRQAVKLPIESEVAKILREISRQQGRKPPVTPPPEGTQRAILREGLSGALRAARLRARQAARDIAAAIQRAAHGAAGQATDTVVVDAAAREAGRRALHEASLQLVGESLNLGRAAAAIEQSVTFAMRSEAMDDHMCDPCGELHGQVARVDSNDFYDILPPNGCDGGGRCRGILVYSDASPGFDY